MSRKHFLYMLIEKKIPENIVLALAFHVRLFCELRREPRAVHLGTTNDEASLENLKHRITYCIQRIIVTMSSSRQLHLHSFHPAGPRTSSLPPLLRHSLAMAFSWSSRLPLLTLPSVPVQTPTSPYQTSWHWSIFTRCTPFPELVLRSKAKLGSKN